MRTRQYIRLSRWWYPVLLALVCFANELSAQDSVIDYQYFNVENGLSHRDVQCIQQDDYGFFWLGTKNGLNRFDGYHFKWFTKENSQLQQNEINFILKDRNGLFWLFHTGAFNDRKVKHIELFAPATHEAQTLRQAFDEQCPFKASEVIDFTIGKDKTLAFLTSQALYTYDGRFEKWATIPSNILPSRKSRIYWTPGGELFLVDKDSDITEANLYLITPENSWGFQSFPPLQDIYKIEQEENNYLAYFYSKEREGVFRFPVYPTPKHQLNIEVIQDKEANPLIDLIKCDNHYLWRCNSEEILSFQPLNQEQPTIVLNDYIPKIRKVTDVYSVSENSFWIATQFGLYIIQKQRPFFRQLLSTAFDPQYGHSCRKMAWNSDDKLWVVMENIHKVFQVDVHTGAYTEPELDLGLQQQIMLGSSRDSGLWYSYRDQVCKIDGNDISCASYPSLVDAYPWSLYEDKYGKLWIPDLHFNDCYYIEDGQIHLLDNWSQDIQEGYIYQIIETPSDLVWLVSNVGLFTMDIRTGGLIDHYWHQGKDKYQLTFDNIHHAHQDKDGTFWLATTAGLIHWHPERGVIKRLTRAEGLPNTNIYAIYEDDFKNLWMPTDHGIAVYNKETGRINGYDVNDGISHNEFNRISHTRDASGNLYFGSLNGITCFHPSEIVNDTHSLKTPLQITNFQQFDGQTEQLVDKTTDLIASRQIRLAPSDRFFKLEFALLAYDDVTNLGYAYQLAGTDNTWNFQRENSLRFSHLPYGKHLLRIKGQNAKGAWSEHILELEIIVLRPFYLQSWFIVLTLLFIIVSLYGLHRWRIWQYQENTKRLELAVQKQTATIQKQTEELRQLDELKSRFFANVSHELRTPLSLIAGPVKTLLKNKEDNVERKMLQFIERNTFQLQKLINEILDLAKLEDNKLEVVEEPVALYPYLKKQLAQFHSAADSQDIHFSFDYSLDKKAVQMLDRSKFEKIIHNFLSNALKHTHPGGSITLSIQQRDASLLLAVKDTGSGIHPDDLPHIFDRFYQAKQSPVSSLGGSGIGLSLCKELAELLEGSVWASSQHHADGNQSGSTFYFEFPRKLSPVSIAPIQDAIKTPFSEAFSATDSLDVDKPLPSKSADRKTPILIVEDNADLREYLSILLYEYDVYTTPNGQVALEYLEEVSRSESLRMPQLIISDLMMPKMDGSTLLTKLKSDNRYRYLPFIMLTAKTNKEVKIDALRVGVDDYLTKPFQEEELKARIANLLRNLRERQDFYSSLKAAEPSDKFPKPQDTAPMMAAEDAEWLKSVELVFQDILADSSLHIDFVAQKLFISVRQLRRRLKQLTGLTPNQYLQEIRLQKAREHLLNGTYKTVKEASYAVGFKNARYFSDLFRKQYGVNPSALNV